MSSDYYPALCQPNVELVTDPIAAVGHRSIRTADGVERAVDTIILGTGFDVTGSTGAATVRGTGGRVLQDVWNERLSAYKSTTVSGFPNLFLMVGPNAGLMVGPNAGLGHTSIVFVIESQIAYILGALSAMASAGGVDRRAARGAGGLGAMADRSRDMVWTGGGCHSYYLDAEGHNVAVWPGSSLELPRRVRRFDPEAYRFTPAGVPAPKGPVLAGRAR